jgi:hypothetical protein
MAAYFRRQDASQENHGAPPVFLFLVHLALAPAAQGRSVGAWHTVADAARSFISTSRIVTPSGLPC